ncbi:MAG TPA: four helix bundle protein [Thermoanaerobaculia bacterium]|nr:four helix bundle protein [Thermoanaerobaculia bacterium]
MNTLRTRTKAFAVAVIRFCMELPRTEEVYVIRRQLLRSATSPGAHCREASRARSNAEMISKLEVAIQELDESVYWMELLAEAGIIPQSHLDLLMREADELLAMTVSAVRTIKRKR